MNVVEALLTIGKGHSLCYVMKTFSICLRIPTMDKKTFDNCVMPLVEESRTVREKFLEASRRRKCNGGFS